MKIARFRLVLAPEGKLVLPEHKGSAFRGAFGAALKRVCCPFFYPCAGRACIIHPGCVYFQDFEALRSKSGSEEGDTDSAGENDEATPKPFVFAPPLDIRRTFGPEDRISVGVTLVGSAIEHYPYYFAAFDWMGQMGMGSGRGKFRIQAGFSVGLAGEEPIYDAERKWLRMDGCRTLTVEEIVDTCPPLIDRVEVHFLSPMLLKKDRGIFYVGRGAPRYNPTLPFDLLVRSLFRRLNRLQALYGGTGKPLNDPALMRKAADIAGLDHDLIWQSFERFSSRQNQKHRLEGFVGQAVYAGDALGGFLPYMKFGEYLHVGNKVAFGLGRYQVSFL